MNQTDDLRDLFTVRHGISTMMPIEDRDARRHLPATVLDPVHPPQFRCACPGAEPGLRASRECILRATQEDRLCDACREECKPC